LETACATPNSALKVCIQSQPFASFFHLFTVFNRVLCSEKVKYEAVAPGLSLYKAWPYIYTSHTDVVYASVGLVPHHYIEYRL
jgi:hypothetical protein